MYEHFLYNNPFRKETTLHLPVSEQRPQAQICKPTLHSVLVRDRTAYV